jgi:hypothetical protein
MGITLATFSLDGTIPEVNNLLIHSKRGIVIQSIIDLIRIVEKPSCPQDNLDCNDKVIFSISLREVSAKTKVFCLYGTPNLEWLGAIGKFLTVLEPRNTKI